MVRFLPKRKSSIFRPINSVLSVAKAKGIDDRILKYFFKSKDYLGDCCNYFTYMSLEEKEILLDAIEYIIEEEEKNLNIMFNFLLM